MKSVLVRKLSALLLALIVAGSIACEDSTGPRPMPGGVEIDPVASVFAVQEINGRKRASVSAVIRNDSERTIYYGYCSERITQRTPAGWAPPYLVACAAIAVPPEPILPGASKEFTLTLIEQFDGTGFPFTDPNAEYRFEVGLMLRRGSAASPRFQQIAPEETVSGTFSIR